MNQAPQSGCLRAGCIGCLALVVLFVLVCGISAVVFRQAIWRTASSAVELGTVATFMEACGYPEEETEPIMEIAGTVVVGYMFGEIPEAKYRAFMDDLTAGGVYGDIFARGVYHRYFAAKAPDAESRRMAERAAARFAAGLRDKTLPPDAIQTLSARFAPKSAAQTMDMNAAAWRTLSFADAKALCEAMQAAADGAKVSDTAPDIDIPATMAEACDRFLDGATIFGQALDFSDVTKDADDADAESEADDAETAPAAPAAH